MINIIGSNAVDPNNSFTEIARTDSEDNLQWIGRNVPSGKDQVTLLLVAGVSTTSFRLRVAQSHVRHDLVPSHWSHVMLLGKAAKNLGSTAVSEISLESAQGFGFPPPTNGLQKGRLGDYRDPKEFPNIALLSVPVDQKAVTDALDRFQKQR